MYSGLSFVLIFAMIIMVSQLLTVEAFLPARVVGNRKLHLSSNFAKLTDIRGGAGAVIEASSISHMNDILSSAGAKKLVVIDFSASWCMPCRNIAPVFADLAKNAQFSNVVFVKVDVDAAPDVAGKYNVAAMPTFVFLKNGVEIERFSGANADRLTKTIQAHK